MWLVNYESSQPQLEMGAQTCATTSFFFTCDDSSPQLSCAGYTFFFFFGKDDKSLYSTLPESNADTVLTARSTVALTCPSSRRDRRSLSPESQVPILIGVTCPGFGSKLRRAARTTRTRGWTSSKTHRCGQTRSSAHSRSTHSRVSIACSVNTK